MSRCWIPLLSLMLAPLASAQVPTAPMSGIELTLACAPPPRLGPPPANTLRIAGSQDSVARTAFAIGDNIVVAGGTKDGIALGQRFFVRRTGVQAYDTYSNGGLIPTPPNARHLSQTIGWIRVTAVNETTAIAAIEHSCAVMASGDYLEPFSPPQVPEAITRPTTLGDLDFSSPAHVLYGDDERSSVAIGEFVVADRPAAPGARFAIYRDLHVPNLPLTSIGEAVVVSQGADLSVLRVVRARDAIYNGDYLVPEKEQK